MAAWGAPQRIAAATALVLAAVVVDMGRRALRSSERPPTPSPGATDTARVPAPAAPRRAATRPVGGPLPESGPGYLEQVARADMRRRIRASAGITYLNELLANSPDSMLRRWDNRVMSPVRVHVGSSQIANYQPAFNDAVRAAFARWEAAGVPVRFNVQADSGSAEVHFRWRIQFEIDRTGQTDLTWNEQGHLQTAVVTLSTFDAQDRPMQPEDIRVVALHEIGHLIGLDHSPDSIDLMFPVARVRDLSPRDVQTALLLYNLAPGSIR